MKRVIVILICILCGGANLAAQDLIVKVDNVEIKAKVTEISPDVVKYKRFSNIEGPTYVLPVADIRYIQYPNGERDVFNNSTAQEVTDNNSVDPQLVPSAQRVVVGAQYEIGDYYSANGIKGVVCALDEGKMHGLVVSLEEAYLAWSIFKKEDMVVVGANNKMDGVANMRIVEKYILDNNLSWDDFPAFKWCRDLGEGWYIPSIDELLQIGHNYNGGGRVSIDRDLRSRFNDALRENGGERMDRMMYHFSSTEIDAKFASSSHMSIDPPYLIDIYKYSKFRVRAVHKF